MAQGGQAGAYQALPGRDSDANLPAEAGLGDASAEYVVVQVLEPGQASAASQKLPGSPTATGGSGASTACAAVAAPPVSEIRSQEAWRVLDWFVAYFLCTSLAHFVIQRNILAGTCALNALLAAFVHLWRRLQQRSKPAEALKAAMDGLVLIPGLALLVGVIAVLTSLGRCNDANKKGECHLTMLASVVYYIACYLLIIHVCGSRDAYFPPPRPKPRVEVLRELARAFDPDSAQALRAQQIRHAVEMLELQEEHALRMFGYAMAWTGSVLEEHKAHRKWSEVAKKLEQLKADPERHLLRPGAPSEPIVTV